MLTKLFVDKGSIWRDFVAGGVGPLPIEEMVLQQG